jgi:hypothetical protein
MQDFLTIGLFLVAWIALTRWVLPAMGIQTCMSGACCGDSCGTSTQRPVLSATDEKTDPQESGPAAEAVQQDVSLNQ